MTNDIHIKNLRQVQDFLTEFAELSVLELTDFRAIGTLQGRATILALLTGWAIDRFPTEE